MNLFFPLLACIHVCVLWSLGGASRARPLLAAAGGSSGYLHVFMRDCPGLRRRGLGLTSFVDCSAPPPHLISRGHAQRRRSRCGTPYLRCCRHHIRYPRRSHGASPGSLFFPRPGGVSPARRGLSHQQHGHRCFERCNHPGSTQDAEVHRSHPSNRPNPDGQSIYVGKRVFYIQNCRGSKTPPRSTCKTKTEERRNGQTVAGHDSSGRQAPRLPPMLLTAKGALCLWMTQRGTLPSSIPISKAQIPSGLWTPDRWPPRAPANLTVRGHREWTSEIADCFKLCE